MTKQCAGETCNFTFACFLALISVPAITIEEVYLHVGMCYVK